MQQNRSEHATEQAPAAAASSNEQAAAFSFNTLTACLMLIG
jgi:hypothetical protein